jgi:hypothetical protein
VTKSCSKQETTRGPHRFKKGVSGNPTGRPKGTQNKVTVDAKTHILRVFDELQKDPKTSLEGVSREKPSWFYEAIYKAIIPREMKADVNHDISGNLMSLAVQVAQELRVNGGNGDK